MKKQYFIKYTEWEDYKHGFYNTTVPSYLSESELIERSVNLLSDKEKFNDKCKIVLQRWINSAKVNLTNPETNHKAWLGQAACCYNHLAPNYITRMAWCLLDEKTQRIANRIAKKNIDEFIIKLYANEHTQTRIEF
jgi:hypothetical protein